MSTNIYIPFTYLIGWSKLNWWYYGVRYAQNCQPNDLWTIYFTSSKEVAIVRDIFGEPNVIQIRKTFQIADKARIWETKVLTRMKVVGDPKWLNKGVNNPPIHIGNNHPMYGLKRNDIARWIYNGNISKRISLDDLIPNNWKLGRGSLNFPPGIRTQQGYHMIATRRSYQGSNNPASKVVIYNGITYYTIKDAVKQTGLSEYKLKKYGYC